ncbi:PaaI family thioesterase [Sporomusa aerivorans]|uniref:PaaI family thioesterase n=1 Tax=Sporomusa aerivorans TaxID=204936 RepID=UPI00352B432B
MLEQSMLLKDHLLKLYSQNAFVTLLKMEILTLDTRLAKLSMPVLADMHTNLYQTAHGGALASLADTAMGMACATTGKKVVTLDMNLNYIRAAECPAALTAVGTVIHDGSRTMVAEADIVDSDGNLIVKARGTFFVTGTFL